MEWAEEGPHTTWTTTEVMSNQDKSHGNHPGSAVNNI